MKDVCVYVDEEGRWRSKARQNRRSGTLGTFRASRSAPDSAEGGCYAAQSMLLFRRGSKFRNFPRFIPLISRGVA